jgi:hypothetical protein
LSKSVSVGLASRDVQQNNWSMAKTFAKSWTTSDPKLQQKQHVAPELDHIHAEHTFNV